MVEDLDLIKGDSHSCSVDPISLRCGRLHRADSDTRAHSRATDASVRQAPHKVLAAPYTWARHKSCSHS